MPDYEEYLIKYQHTISSLHPLLPDTDAHGALTLAENIREKVEEKHFYHVGHITISLGVYQMSPRDIFVGDIIEKADKALYKSKNSGRNKVSLWLD